MPKRKEPNERDPLLTAIGKQIRIHREGTGLSQERFALKAGLDRTYYAAIELGYRNVSARNLVKIASNLRVEVGNLFPDIAQLEPLLIDTQNGDLPES